MLVAMTGVGVAADRAVPGDVLYPLDRALEAVGLTSPLVEERLLEAIALTERGEMVLAVETANEALAELGRSGVTATLPVPTVDSEELTAETVEESSTTTTEEETAATTTAAPADDVTVDSAPDDDVVVEAAQEPIDVSEALRLAAEQLLQSVRSAKIDPATSGNVTSAALFLAEATAGATSAEETDETTSTTTSTTTSSTSSTTSTTIAELLADDGDGNIDESGTTTTTVASDSDEESGSDDSEGDGEDDSPGPIFLPSP